MTRAIETVIDDFEIEEDYTLLRFSDVYAALEAASIEMEEAEPQT